MSIRDLIRWDRPTQISVRQNQLGQSLSALQEEMNRLFEHFYNGAQVHLTNWGEAAPPAPALDFAESETGYKMTMELAGISPEDVDVEISASTLTVRGEKKEERKEEKNNYLRQEISYGSFYRSVSMPEAGDYKKAEATFKNGVLTVEIPKKADAIQKPEKLQVKKVA